PPLRGARVGVLLPLRGGPPAVDLGHGAGGRGTGTLAGGDAAHGSVADRSGPACVQDRPVFDALRRRGAVDPALRLQQRDRSERAAADDRLAAGLRDADEGPGRRGARLAAPGRGSCHAAALRHGVLVPLLAGRSGGPARLSQVRHPPTWDPLQTNQRPYARGVRAALWRRSPRAAGPQARRRPGRDLPVAAGRLPRLRALRLLGLEAFDGTPPRRGERPEAD